MDMKEKNGEQMGNQRITVTDDHINLLKKEDGAMRSDNFIVDLESFSNGSSKEPTFSSTNSRITLQRSLSRKGPQRVAERNSNDRDSLSPSSSPTAASQVISMSEKPMSSLNPPDQSGQLPQHAITIKTGVLSPLAEGKWGRRPSFKRSPPSWFFDPKRILLFFATLSSMGTILLIYFTLSMGKRNAKEVILDWQ